MASWYDTKQAAVDEDNPLANEQTTFTEWNAMVAYLKDKIIGKEVDDSAIGDDKILVYDLVNDRFVFETPSTISALGDINNVTISGVPADNEVLAWDGVSAWINQTAAEAELATTTQLTALETAAVLEADYNATTFMYATADNTPLPKTPAEVMAILSGAAGAEFLFNTQKIGGIVDPTTAQQAATKNYADSHLFTKEAVTTFTNGYVPVYRTASGKFEMEEQSVAAGTYLPLAGGTMAGDLNMDDYQINGVDDIKSNDSNGIAIRTSSGAIAMYFSWFGYAFVAHNDSSMGGFTLKTMADPTAAQDAATKNYADTRLLSKEVVTDWTDGYIPVYNATSGKFEMENVALPIFEESSNVIRERTGYDNDFVVGSPQLADDGNTAHDARMWFDKGSAAFRAGGVSGAEWDAGNVGNYSHAEGIDTTASGIASHAEGGDSVASGNRSHAEGNYTTASGENSHAEGNYSNASGSRSHAEGRYAEAIGDYSHAEGFYAKAYLDTQHAKAAGQFAAKGDAQISNVVARIETTDATAAVEMFIDGSSKQAVLPENRTWAFIINIAARQTAGAGTVGDSGIYKIEGGIKRDGAGNTALVGAITKTTLAEDQAAWDVTAEADNTNEALVVKVTGEASKTIHWVAAINLVEVG